MRLESERRDDAEVPAASAAAGPVQVLVPTGSAMVRGPVRRHDLHGLQLVAGEPIRPGEHADPSAEGQSGDPHSGTRATGQEKSLCRKLAVDIDQDVPRPDGDEAFPRAPCGTADGEVVQIRHVDDEAWTGRIRGVAVPTRTRRHLDVGVPGEGEAALDIAGRPALCDCRRLLRVDAVVQVAGRGIPAVSGEKQGAAE